MQSLKFSKFSKLSSPAIKILDCRSPIEFHEDHPPNSINTPVLTNSERESVGTLYKSDKFQAKRLGAQLISKNISSLLTTFDYPQSQEFLLYCARGGQRSQSLGLILDKIGYPVTILEKGYKSYRSGVLDFIKNIELWSVFVLYGKTGSGKTLLLKHLKRLGAQILDLEECACHRGSILGSLPNMEKPSQKQFESNIYFALSHLDPTKPIYIEGESKYVGRVSIPEAIWKILMNSPKIYIQLENMEERIKYIRSEYQHFETDSNKDHFLDLLTILKKPTMKSLVETRDFDQLVHQLLVTHYDVLYKKTWKDCEHTFSIDRISQMENLAHEIYHKFNQVESPLHQK
jgi:tRNA 2-selenouridine synthase